MTADTIGGVWNYSLELARSLAAHGVQITLATMGAPASTAQRAEVAALENVVLHESAYRLEWQDDPWGDVERAGRWLLDLRAQVEPDLIHLNGYAHAALDWQAPCLVVAHSCVLSWWRAVQGESAPASRDRYRAAVREGLAHADAVVAPTRWMLESLSENYGLSLRSPRVIANACGPRSFQPEHKQPFIVTAGRFWDAAKNLATLERAARALPWPLLAAGDGAENDLRSSIHHLGRLSSAALERHLALASIYALPARYEPFGLSILEAAASGCALVLGDTASLRELWDGAALFVDPDDAEAIARALRRLIADPEERADLGLRAHQRAQDFTPERMAADYLALYQEVLAGYAPNERVAA